VLGYSREVSAVIRDHVLVLGNPLQAIQPPPAVPVSDAVPTGDSER
jgi:hypothetical protein